MPSRISRPHHVGLLRLIFAHEVDLPLSRCCPSLPRDDRDDVFVARIKQGLRGVDTQSIKVEFVDPVGGILRDIFANATAVRTVEVDRLAPFVRVTLCEIVGREFAKRSPLPK